MTTHNASLIAAFLGELSDRYGNDGCNDMALLDTPENRELVIAAERFADFGSGELNLSHGKILTNNHIVVNYLRSVLMDGHGLNDSEIPNIQ